MTHNADDAPVTDTLTAVGFDRDHNPVVVVDTDVTDIQVAVGVSDTHGLQVQVIDVHSHARAEDKEPPARVADTRIVCDVDSFLAELNRRALVEGASTLWGAVDAGRIQAIYDDHTMFEAAWRQDRLQLALVADPDWKRWHNLSDQWMPQEAFGDQIEDLLHTIVEPDHADLLEVIDSIRASTSGEFESGINRANGALTASYRTDVQTRAGRSGELEVPQRIRLQLRPWEGHAQTYEVIAQFRLRIENGVLRMGIKLAPTRVIKLQAWRDLTDQITDEVGVPVYTTLSSTIDVC